MASTSYKLAVASFVVFSLFLSPCFAQRCRNYPFSTNRFFASCNDLPVLNSYLHWNFDSATGNLQIAYRHENVSSSTWVAWAINPTGRSMVGSQALVAYQDANGAMRVFSPAITSYGTRMQEGRLSFDVSDLSAISANNEITIFATLRLPKNSTTVNQVWQDGPLHGDTPAMHSMSGPNIRSVATLDLLSGQSADTGTTETEGVDSKTINRNTHGMLNAISWGILMPLGVVIARYVRVFPSADPAWFYLHMGCQTSAYIIGIAGVATGLKLGGESKGIQYNSHRIIGILLFCLATLQVLAMFLRPKKDHKYRKYWNLYHHSVGYAVIILSIVNVFKGLDILEPEKKWKYAYVGVIVTLGAIAACLEAFTWFVVLRRKKNQNSAEKMPDIGVNGYIGRQQQTV